MQCTFCSTYPQTMHLHRNHNSAMMSCMPCRDYVRAEVGQMPPTRPVYLLGESFGGLLAIAVAAELPDLVDRVVLVNPATSFTRSVWPVLGPLLPSVPPVSPFQLLSHSTCNACTGCRRGN